jgi:hypothetical protein
MFGKVHSHISPQKKLASSFFSSLLSFFLYLRTRKLGACTGYKIFFPPFFVSLLSSVSAPHSFYLSQLLLFIIFSGTPAQRGLWLPRSRGFLITHNGTPQSAGLLWTSDQLGAETST